jgi:hypothetical protein
MNLIDDEWRGEPVGVAAMSASGFRIAGARPVLGGPLLDADEQPSALPVIVIGYDSWQTRFNGDSTIVGRTDQMYLMVHVRGGADPSAFSRTLRTVSARPCFRGRSLRSVPASSWEAGSWRCSSS